MWEGSVFLLALGALVSPATGTLRGMKWVGRNSGLNKKSKTSYRAFQPFRRYSRSAVPGHRTEEGARGRPHCGAQESNARRPRPCRQYPPRMLGKDASSSPDNKTCT